MQHDIADGGDLVVHRLGRPFVNLGLAVVDQILDPFFRRFQLGQLGHQQLLRASQLLIGRPHRRHSLFVGQLEFIHSRKRRDQRIERLGRLLVQL